MSELEKPSNQRRGLYESIAILQLLCESIFRKKGPGLALRFHHLFGKFLPLQTFAWVLTMVCSLSPARRHCLRLALRQLQWGITEWGTGIHEDNVFMEVQWKKVYFDHIADLKGRLNPTPIV